MPGKKNSRKLIFTSDQLIEHYNSIQKEEPQKITLPLPSKLNDAQKVSMVTRAIATTYDDVYKFTASNIEMDANLLFPIEKNFEIEREKVENLLAIKNQLEKRFSQDDQTSQIKQKINDTLSKFINNPKYNINKAADEITTEYNALLQEKKGSFHSKNTSSSKTTASKPESAPTQQQPPALSSSTGFMQQLFGSSTIGKENEKPKKSYGDDESIFSLPTKKFTSLSKPELKEAATPSDFIHHKGSKFFTAKYNSEDRQTIIKGHDYSREDYKNFINIGIKMTKK